MFLTLEKLIARTVELGGRRYFGNRTIAPFVSMTGTQGADDVYHQLPEKIEGETFGLNDFFVGRDKYLWIEKELTLLPEKEGCKVVGLFDFGKSVESLIKSFESLLYVDGKPYQGVDSFHNEVIFNGLEGKHVRLTFLLWTGLEGEGRRSDFYHRCKKADMAFLLIGWDEEEFYETVSDALHSLKADIEKIGKHSEVTIHAIGHTHIDVAWLWRLKHTREKAQRSFSTVLHLMDNYDEYVFLQTQPQLYQYIKNDAPEIYEKIKERVAEGKWEPEGGMWLEADCNLTSGESLVRQLLHGTRFIEKEFGKKCEYLWLPDVFGYSWALPQILKQAGIKTFMTSKISWNQCNVIPEDLFWWRGIDGSEILTYFISTPSEGQDWTDGATYNGLLTPNSVVGSWKKFKSKNLSKDVLIPYGYGDGGGGVNRDMLECRRKLNEIPGLPNVKTGKAGEFFKLLHDNVENTDQYVHKTASGTENRRRLLCNGRKQPVPDYRCYLDSAKSRRTDRSFCGRP